MSLMVSHEQCSDLQGASGQQPARAGKPIGRDPLVLDGEGAVQNADIAVSGLRNGGAGGCEEPCSRQGSRGDEQISTARSGWFCGHLNLLWTKTASSPLQTSTSRAGIQSVSGRHPRRHASVRHSFYACRLSVHGPVSSRSPSPTHREAVRSEQAKIKFKLGLIASRRRSRSVAIPATRTVCYLSPRGFPFI